MLAVERKALAGVLEVLEGVVEPKAANPLYAYVRLSVEEGEVRLSGTSAESHVEAAFPHREAPGEWAGRAMLLPGEVLFRLARLLPGDAVALSLEEKGLGLRSGPFETRLAAAEPEGWEEPEAPPPILALPARSLLEALSGADYAVSREEHRGVFRGVQLELLGRSLRVVASDGYRLALVHLEGALTPLAAPEEGEGRPSKLVVPGRSVPLIKKLLRLAGEGDPVQLAPTGASLDLHLAPKDKPYRFRASFRLMEGEFPDYERVIPKEAVLEVELDSPGLREALGRLMVIADRQNHRIDLTFEEGRLALAAFGDYGEGREEVEVRTILAAELPFAVSFNGRYLLEALEPVSGAARLLLSGAQTPALVEDLSGSGYRAVVVPLRV